MGGSGKVGSGFLIALRGRQIQHAAERGGDGHHDARVGHTADGDTEAADSAFRKRHVVLQADGERRSAGKSKRLVGRGTADAAAVQRRRAEKKDIARALCKKFKQAVHHVSARCVTIETKPLPKRAGFIAVVCAGTSDLPVAEEAAVTAEIMGNRVERVHDVGVAGLHRMLARMELLQSANVIVAVAGMEGALPGVIAGLVAKPVIAVPTSVGYGTSFGGIAALLAMLNSCASGVTVVNIDNGFGAGYAASQINALAEK